MAAPFPALPNLTPLMTKREPPRLPAHADV
jgi:hypothetical protein